MARKEKKKSGYRFISDGADYRHLNDRERYKNLYEEVGTVPANRKIEWREEWMKYFNPEPESSILELGAHNGPNLLHYARLGHRMHGVELSETLIRTFREECAGESSDVLARIHIEQGWIEQFKPATKYDYVLCTEILEHVVDPVEILRVARDSVNSAGWIYISSPSFHWGNNTHVRGVPVTELKTWLERAKLVPVEIWSEEGRTFCIANKLPTKVIGLLRVRNEADLIADTLDQMSRYCSGGICVYDDASSDDTAAICRKHPSVLEVVGGKEWSTRRLDAEYQNRAAVLECGKKYAGEGDWFVYLDADERCEFDWKKLVAYPPDVIGVKMKLFDFYITPDDVGAPYASRRFLGPEYRPILMAFRNLPSLSYSRPDQREVDLGIDGKVVTDGYVRHYGKATSIARWEEKCDYYAAHFPPYAEKWKRRKGKALHTASDFGAGLITWGEKDSKGYPLTPEIEQQSALNAVHDSPRRRILISNHHLLDWTGSEVFTLTLAEAIKEAGHDVTVYSNYIDKLKPRFAGAGIRCVETLQEISSEQFDIAHVHHNLNAMEVRHCFPELPVVMCVHGVIPFFEQPPVADCGVAAWLAVSEEVAAHLVSKGIPESRITVVRNLVRESQFKPSSPIHRKAANALIISNRLDERREMIIRQACEASGISCRFIGGRFGEAGNGELPGLINGADIVFSLGRGAVEAMLCGRIPVIFDYLGGDGMVTPETLDGIMKCNFSGRSGGNDYSVTGLQEELAKYRSEYGAVLRERALALFSTAYGLKCYTDVYEDAIKNGGTTAIAGRDSELIDVIVETVRETRNYAYNKWTRIQKARDERLAARKSPDPGGLIGEAEGLIQQNRLDDARTLLSQFAPMEQILLQAWNNMAVVDILQGKNESAGVHLRRVLALDPSNEIARDNMRCIGAGAPALAAPLTGSLTEEEEYRRAHQLINEGQFDAAAGILERLISQNPSSAEYLNDCGAVYFAQGSAERAVPMLHRAVTMEPENLTFRKNLADCYVGMKRYSEALNTYQGILSSAPDDTEALFSTGELLHEMGLQEESAWCFIRTRELDPENTEALRRIEEIRGVRPVPPADKTEGDSRGPAASKKRVTVLVPHRGNSESTVACIREISRTSSGQFEEIIVADCSGDASARVLKEAPIDVPIRVLALSRAFSDPDALNTIARLAAGNYFLLCDPGVCLKERTLEGLLATISMRPSIAACVPRVLTESGLLAEAGYSSVNAGGVRGFGEGESPDDPRFNFVTTVAAGSRFVMLLRRSEFLECGGLDPVYRDFPAALIDCGCEVARKGYEIVYQPFFSASASPRDGSIGQRPVKTGPPLEFFNEKRPEIIGLNPRQRNKRPEKRKKVLVAGVYLADRENTAADIAAVISASKDFDVVQKWVAIGDGTPDETLAAVTVARLDGMKPKYAILNDLFDREHLEDFDFIINIDDDVVLPHGFIDEFCRRQAQLGFVIAQPARTLNSWIDHPIVGRQPGVIARRTHFVEIGPVISFHRSVYGMVFPFDCTSSMGWGYENVWAYNCREANLPIGIIDAVPIDHSLRKPVVNYTWEKADRERSEYFRMHPYMPYEECFRVLDIITDLE
jgi:tetratricopeptide (TPR) repeat protein/2-polyprenyl-3-methyl-5-hydroxy-6-metoxy-1,4-benzoquinol methylase